MNCENQRHKQHLKAFLKKYPTASKPATHAFITVNPEDWAIDLEHTERNKVQCYQMCSIQEDIKRTMSPERRNEPDKYCSCQREGTV